MAHISYSELKDWMFCAFYHKLTRIDKLKGFVGNEFTAFGSAIHSVCEKKLLKEEITDDYFVDEFKKNIASVNDLVLTEEKFDTFVKQGKEIIPEIKDALDNYFGEYEVLEVEMKLYEPIENEENHLFKGFIDAVVATPDGKVHIFDWKTCGWGWPTRKKSEKITTYQLTLYKHFFVKKMEIDPKDVETHFALLKRTAKKNKVEFFRVSSGPKKTENALKALRTALYNIKEKRYIKNRMSCTSGFGCQFHDTKHCTR